ncbi:MAG: hypothetical protein WAL20_00125, partial [Rhodomicrobium sp.]
GLGEAVTKEAEVGSIDGEQVESLKHYAQRSPSEWKRRSGKLVASWLDTTEVAAHRPARDLRLELALLPLLLPLLTARPP